MSLQTPIMIRALQRKLYRETKEELTPRDDACGRRSFPCASRRSQSESRMREIRTSGSMSGDGKRSVAAWPKLPRPSSTLPQRHFAAAQRFGAFGCEADMRTVDRSNQSDVNDPQAT